MSTVAIAGLNAMSPGICSATTSKVPNVHGFGAKGDGVTLDTAAVQAAVNACTPGAMVRVGPGRYVIGTIKLKSEMELHLAEGAELLGSLSLADYDPDTRAIEAPADNKCLIYAKNARNLKITGPGIINGRGMKEYFPVKVGRAWGERPMLIRFVHCQGIAFSDITLRDSPSWCVHLLSCDDITASKVTINSHVNVNNDGFDLDGCGNVLIQNCTLRTGDDAICPKSTTAKLCENIVVKNCRVQSNTAAFKCGTSSRGGFKDITVSDCDFSGCRMGVIKLTLVDGGIMQNISISNIIANDVEGPIFIRLGNRGRLYDKPTQQFQRADAQPEGAPVGSIKNIRISNVTATLTGTEPDRQGIMITGIPGHNVEDVVLENIKVSFVGNGTAEDARRTVPENIAQYPGQTFFGILPSYGIYLRHVDGMVLRKVNLSLQNPDQRPAIVGEDVNRLRIYR